MMQLLWIGLGGFFGAVLRYLLTGAIQLGFKGNEFPIGTLSVNLIGCLVIGVLTVFAEGQEIFNPQVRGFVFVGLLGAFTTFSTFGNDSFSLLQSGNDLLAWGNIGLHIIFGLGAVWLGRMIGVLFIQ